MRRSFPFLARTLVLAMCSLAACGGDDGDGDGKAAPPAPAPPAPASPTGAGAVPKRFAIGSSVSDADSETGYLKFLPSLELGGGTVDLRSGREFGGSSDVWALGKSIYIASGDQPTITRYEGESETTLAARGTVSFASHGISSAAFWNNTFVSPTKAYMANGASNLIVWNPTTMTITGQIDVPGLDKRGVLEPKPALADRSSIVYGGKAYLPVYWTDENYAGRTPDSVIVVIDTATDAVLSKISVPCTGMDYGTVTEDGRLFFSNWTGSVGTHLVLKTPPSCFAEVDPKTDTVRATTLFQDVTGGHQAAAMKYVGKGKFVFTVFDEIRANAAQAVKPGALVGTPNWQLWSFDLATKQGKPIEGVDWNSGAVYYADVGGVTHAMLPGANYENTNVYRLVDGVATKLYDVTGWSLRLFAITE
ncbi:MAG: hypothetical protein ABW252_00505 [Polyangiales bacterium]